MLTLNAQTQEITIDQGDDQTVRFTITDEDGAVIDASAGTFKFTVKQFYDDTSAQFQITDSDDIDISQAASGIVDVAIQPADTATLAGRYVYDLEMTLASKVRTLRRGRFFVRKDVS